MERQTIPGWYFPTTVLFVDDNRKFLNSLRLIINPKIMAAKFIDDPLDALKYLDAQQPVNNFMQRCLSKSEAEPSGYQSIDININAIHQEIYNPKRFDEISVIVVDHAMPSLSGLEFCLQVRAKFPYLKIIMLTGEADEKFAVQAFNQGSIDKFLRKDANNFQQELNETVNSLQLIYCQELSQLMLKGINENISLYAKISNNPAFINLFNNIIKEYDISEYYLLDLDGGYLLQSFSGKQIMFVIKDEETMEDTYQIAFHSDEDFPESTLNAMHKREKILCLYQDDICDSPTEAEKYLFPAEKMANDPRFYYAIVNDLKAYDLNPENILSFKAYSEALN